MLTPLDIMGIIICYTYLVYALKAIFLLKLHDFHLPFENGTNKNEKQIYKFMS